MHNDYQPFLSRVIDKYEGGYGWQKSDPGGPTKFGITCYDLAAHRGQKMTSMTQWAPFVNAMTRSEAEDIYWGRYAIPLRFDDLPAGIDCCMLDYGINSGVSRSLLVANRIAGLSGSSMTAALVAYLQKCDAKTFVTTMCVERMNFLRGLKLWGEDGKGWTARVTDLENYCYNIIEGVSIHSGVVVTKTKKGVQKTSGGGVTSTVIVGGGGVVTAAAHGGLPVWACYLLGGAAVAAAVGFGIYAAYKDNAANTTVHL